MYFWNLVVTARRLVVVALLATLGESRATMFSLITIVNLAFLLLHLRVQPFKDRRSNQLETFAMVMLTVTSALMASFGREDQPLSDSQTAVYLALLWAPLACLGIAIGVRVLRKLGCRLPVKAAGRDQNDPVRAHDLADTGSAETVEMRELVDSNATWFERMNDSD